MKRELSAGWKTTEAAEFPTRPCCRLSQGEKQRGKASAGRAPRSPCPPRARSPYIKSINRKFHFFRKKNRIRIFHKCPRGHESRIRKFHSAEILKLPQPFRQLQNSSCSRVPRAGAGWGHAPFCTTSCPTGSEGGGAAALPSAASQGGGSRSSVSLSYRKAGG